MSDFSSRVMQLPILGLGISTEYGAASAEGALDPFELVKCRPHCARFMELGIELQKGLDESALRWLSERRPVTYHFLDINLDDPKELDTRWVASLHSMIDQVKPSWLCGDAGLWHLGARAPEQMLLLPPILSKESAHAFADGIIALRELSGLEVFPENPPGHLFIGDLHLLDFLAEVCERADTGLLLDAAHLAIYQQAMGYPPCAGLDGFPLERIVELHLAGGSEQEVEGCLILEDDHSPTIRPETWEIFEQIMPTISRTNLRAVVFECERNPLEACLEPLDFLFARLSDYGWGHPADLSAPV
ncbi:MAG: DUF692 family multinuclear iron-containing protein [Myxococcota bacterium]|nr:DUF692 family multinuclear iron-containing protein [Myxococcota bacterium]